jgi:hypothetical protein
MQETKRPNDPFLDKSIFFGGSFAAVGLGMLIGFQRVASKENFKLNIKAHTVPFAVATKALVAGTLLCFGTFGVVTATFITATGITSLSEFSISARKAFSGFDLQKKSPSALEDEMNTKGMNENQELDYVSKKYFSGEDNNGK